MIKIKWIIFLLTFFCLISQETLSQTTKILIKKIQFTEKNQLEIFISSKAESKIFTLENPDRLVVDIKNSTLANPEYKPLLPFFIKSFRSKNDQNSLRLVFDLTQKISLQNTHFEKQSNKIVSEIIGIKNGDFISNKVEEFEVQTTRVANPDGSAKYVVKKIPLTISTNQTANSAPQKKIPVIVIDAGHGGKDPGAIGNFARTKEKNITLSYAKELSKQLLNKGKYKVYLTRDDDFFIPLRKRVDKARKKKADLFVSLHANAAEDRSAYGFSIYTLSEKSSDKQAELLAQKENRADIINGIDFSNASRDVVKTLIDLSQRESKNNSARFANIAIKSIKDSEIKILQNSHRFAGFAVLTAPDMASVLIELGYLSNKEEEKLLNSVSYKRRIGAGLVRAIDEYFSKSKN